MKFTAAFSILAYYQAATTSAFSSSPAFASNKASATSSHLGSAVAGTDVYTFTKSEEIFAEAQEVRPDRDHTRLVAAVSTINSHPSCLYDLLVGFN
jgi:hypothetical protein